MKTRKLTIEPLFGYSPANPKTPAAYLRLKGYWLRELGFQPGDLVEVVAEGETLVIRKPVELAQALLKAEPTRRNQRLTKR
jgi:hypothetical protein